MLRSDFVAESLAGWAQKRPDEDLLGLEIVQRVIWSGRVAEELLERTAIESGLRRPAITRCWPFCDGLEPALLTPAEVAQQLMSSQSGMTGKLDRLKQQGLTFRSSVDRGASSCPDSGAPNRAGGRLGSHWAKPAAPPPGAVA